MGGGAAEGAAQLKVLEEAPLRVRSMAAALVSSRGPPAPKAEDACFSGRWHLLLASSEAPSLILSLLRRSHDALLQKAKKQALQRIDAYPAELPPPPPPWWKVGAGAGQHLLILATCPLPCDTPCTLPAGLALAPSASQVAGVRDFSKENAPLDEQMQHYLDHGSEDDGEEEEAQAAPPPQVLRITRRSGRGGGEGEAAVASPEVATRAETAAKPVDRVPTNTDAEVRAIAAQVRLRSRATPSIALAMPRSRSCALPRLSAQAAESNAGYSFEQAGALWAKHLGQMNAWNERIKPADDKAGGEGGAAAAEGGGEAVVAAPPTAQAARREPGRPPKNAAAKDEGGKGKGAAAEGAVEDREAAAARDGSEARGVRSRSAAPGTWRQETLRQREAAALMRQTTVVEGKRAAAQGASSPPTSPTKQHAMTRGRAAAPAATGNALGFPQQKRRRGS